MPVVSSFIYVSLQISWFDENNSLIPTATYTSSRREGEKLFSASSTITVHPTKQLHNKTYQCEAWNDAGGTRPALVRFNVKYSPSVTVKPIRHGRAREGEKVGFR